MPSDPPQPAELTGVPSQPGRLSSGAFLVLACCFAAVVRLALLWDDFTWDEIWSLLLATSVSSPLEIFRTTHDNNHLLNTLTLYLVGWQTSWVWYRLPAFVAGCAAAVLLCLTPCSVGREERWVFATLSALCFPLAYYSTEARGYSLALMCSLLSFLAVRRFHARTAWRTAALCWCSAVVGFLAHPTSGVPFLALLAWSAVALRRGRTWRAATVAWLKCHLLPLLLLSGTYLAFFRRMTIGGGPIEDLHRVVLEFVASLAGVGPEAHLAVALGAGLLVLVLAIAGLLELRRAGGDEWVFLGGAVFLAPALIIALRRPTYIYPRYFLVCAPFVLVLVGHALCAALRRGGPRRVIAAALVGLFAAASATQVHRLTTTGRASYHDAVMFMGEATPGPVVEVSSDHDFRNALVLAFYGLYLRHGQHLRYHPEARWPPAGPEWMILHEFRDEYAGVQFFQRETGPAYRLARRFPHYGTSGWDWLVFRRISGPLPPEARGRTGGPRRQPR